MILTFDLRPKACVVDDCPRGRPNLADAAMMTGNAEADKGHLYLYILVMSLVREGKIQYNTIP